MDDRTHPPRWRAVLGSLLVVVLLGLLVGRATGVVGGGDELLSSEEPAPAQEATTSGTPASSSAGTADSDPTRSPRRDRDKDRDKDRDRPRDRRPQGAPATDVPGGALLARRVQDLLGDTSEVQPLTFRVSSLNVLGASHTTARGNKPRYASGVARMPGKLDLLEQLDVDVVGLQEFEMVQFQTLKRLTGDRYGVYPGAALGRGPIRNSIAWRNDVWELVDSRTIPIPYFRGKRVPMPYILLKHRETEQAVWFINIHNPTSNKKRGNNERWRDLGTRMEVTLANRLNRRTSLPVVLMGDFNERKEAFCTVTRGGLVAANGGSTNPCVPPANHGIDWIFGTRDIEFSDYLRLDNARVNRLTDHPMLVATARVGGD